MAKRKRSVPESEIDPGVTRDVIRRFLESHGWAVSLRAHAHGIQAVGEHPTEGTLEGIGASDADAIMKLAAACLKKERDVFEPTEIPSDGPGGWPVPSELLDFAVYRLLCVFAASAGISSLCKRSNDYFSFVRSNFECVEASRLLLNIAIISRNQLDSAVDAAERRNALPTNVGTLKQLDDKTSRPLNFREACNKIIHADQVNFDASSASGSAQQSLNPRVHLYGTLNSRTWKATIEMYPFLEGCHFV